MYIDGTKAVREKLTTKAPGNFFAEPVAVLANMVAGSEVNSWVFQVGMVSSSGMALGMCLEHLQSGHSYIGGNWWTPLNHGMYMVRSTVNYAYGDATINRKDHTLRFGSLDRLTMKYDAAAGKLTVLKNESPFFEFPKILASSGMYRPCAYLFSVKDSVNIERAFE